MAPMIKFDQFVMSIFEYIAHKIQAYTGINNFTVSRTVVVVYVIINSSINVRSHQYGQLILDILGCGLVVWQLFEVEKIYWERQALNAKTKNLFQNTNIGIFSRYVFLVVSIFNALDLMGIKLFKFADAYFTATMWTALCFAACTPLPPGMSKIKEWINSFSQKPAMQEN